MTNAESTLNQLNVNAITGVSLMNMLGIGLDELSDPRRFAQLEQVIAFLKQFPDDTQRFLVSKATAGKQVDKLSHMFEYTNLLKNKEGQEKVIDGIIKEKSALEMSNDTFRIQEVASQEEAALQTLARLKDEIAIYEK